MKSTFHSIMNLIFFKDSILYCNYKFLIYNHEALNLIIFKIDGILYGEVYLWPKI